MKEHRKIFDKFCYDNRLTPEERVEILLGFAAKYASADTFLVYLEDEASKQIEERDSESRKYTTGEDAILLIRETKEALARGTKHFHPRTGEPLTTVEAILACLLAEGGVVFEPVTGKD
jgi:hypothetical protein